MSDVVVFDRDRFDVNGALVGHEFGRLDDLRNFEYLLDHLRPLADARRTGEAEVQIEPDLLVIDGRRVTGDAASGFEAAHPVVRCVVRDAPVLGQFVDGLADPRAQVEFQYGGFDVTVSGDGDVSLQNVADAE